MNGMILFGSTSIICNAYMQHGVLILSYMTILSVCDVFQIQIANACDAVIGQYIL